MTLYSKLADYTDSNTPVFSAGRFNPLTQTKLNTDKTEHSDMSFT